MSAVSASLARSLATVRIRSAVLPISTTPAPRAISQPVVPFWVTCTSSWIGWPDPAARDSVSSWAVTGTMPLARAVTSASTVTLSWARISGSSIGLMVSRRSLSEVNTSRARMALVVGVGAGRAGCCAP